MKKTTLAILMASLMLVTIFSACFSVSAQQCDYVKSELYVLKTKNQDNEGLGDDLPDLYIDKIEIKKYWNRGLKEWIYNVYTTVGNSGTEDFQATEQKFIVIFWDMRDPPDYWLGQGYDSAIIPAGETRTYGGWGYTTEYIKKYANDGELLVSVRLDLYLADEDNLVTLDEDDETFSLKDLSYAYVEKTNSQSTLII